MVEEKERKTLTPLEQAGVKLLAMAHAQMRRLSPTSQSQELPNNIVADELRAIRNLLAQCDPSEDPYRFRAAKTALEGLEAMERGDHQLETGKLFDSDVEAICGGPRELNLGGRQINNKLSAKEYFLRAAAIKLWQKYPDDRDQLVKDAVSLKVVGSSTDSRQKNRERLRRIVDNFKQRSHDVPGQPRSPILDQWAVVSELVDNYNYSRLEEFL